MVEFGEEFVVGIFVIVDVEGKVIVFDVVNFVGEVELYVVGWVMEDGVVGMIGDVFLNLYFVVNILSV